MYAPFSGAMNYALRRLSEVDVNGLPAFKDHIAFVPCSERGIQSNRAEPGSSFKPDIAVMAIQDVYEFYEPGRRDGPELSELIGSIAEKAPSGQISWHTVLSAVEVKRTNAKWAPFFDQGGQNEPPKSVNVQPNQEQSCSRSTTRKIDLLLQDFVLTPVVQHFHRRLCSHPSDLPMLRGWMAAPRSRATSESADRVHSRTPRLNITLKTGYTLLRNSLIRSPPATW
jgi:hypothetical protein